MAGPKKADEKPAEKHPGHAALEAREAEVQKQGYVGRVPDSTPNENYTLAGVIAGKPTPETQRR